MIGIEEMKGRNTMGKEIKETKRCYTFMKRCIDLILSAIGIILLSPIIIILCLLIKLDSRGPILFKQKRIGKNKEEFYIWKFRTMRIDTPHDVPTHMLDNADQYITRMGKFLRKTSLDELPQLFQIFTGKMSIVGPRPALWNQYDLITKRDEGLANSIRPGLTGWAQTHGRDELEIDVKAKFDNYYAEHMSFALDVKCFFRTIVQVCKQEGVVEGKQD